MTGLHDEQRLVHAADTARECEERGDWLRAVQQYLLLIEERPDLLEARVKLAYAYAELGNLRAAEQVLLRALGNAFEPPDVINALGEMFLRFGDEDRAVWYYEQLLPKAMPHVHATMGLIAWRRGELSQAERHLARCLDLDPGRPAVRLLLGEVLLNRGRSRAAVELLERYDSCNSADWKAQYLLSAAYAAEGRFEDARHACEKAMALRGGEPRLLAAAAEYGMRLGDMDGAERLLCDALSKAPESTEVLNGLGFLALMKADRRKALEMFSRTLSIDPGDTIALGHVRLLELRRG